MSPVLSSSSPALRVLFSYALYPSTDFSVLYVQQSCAVKLRVSLPEQVVEVVGIPYVNNLLNKSVCLFFVGVVYTFARLPCEENLICLYTKGSFT